MVLPRIFIESQDRLFKRNATGMHVELLVHVPVDYVPRNPQRRVDLDRPTPAFRIGIPQPPPLRVRFERAKDTRGLIHLVRNAEGLEPRVAVAARHLPVEERKHRRQPMALGQPLANPDGAASFIQRDAVRLVHHCASRYPLSARHSQEFAADVAFNRIDLVLTRALAANNPGLVALARRRERGNRRESLAGELRPCWRSSPSLPMLTETIGGPLSDFSHSRWR